MATDEERRRVAERLREQGIRFYSPSAWNALGEALGIDGARNSDTVRDRLADLIEPSCDRAALLDMEDEMFEDATGLAFISQLEKNEELQDLQSTMAKALMDYARRIREACGEAVA